MRAMGALLLIAACTLIGADRARALRFHQRCVSDALAALRCLDAELSTAGTPTPEIFASLARRTGSPLACVFQTLAEELPESEEGLAYVWARSWLRDRRILFSQDERRALARLGDILGRYPGEEQSQAVRGCIACFEEAAGRSEKSAREGMKLCTGVGLCLGLMLAAALL